MTKGTRVFRGILVGFAVLLVALICAVKWYKEQVGNFEHTKLADVYLSSPGEAPLRVTCRVVNMEGTPLPGVCVVVRNNSGHNMMLTDDSGFVDIGVSEQDIDLVQINEHVVLSRPHAYQFGYPNVTRGLHILIVVKTPTMLGARRHGC